MDKYFIYLKPEFSKDQITADHFTEFFKSKGFTITNQVSYLDSNNISINKSGVLLAIKDTIIIKYLYSSTTVLGYFDSRVIEYFKLFQNHLPFPTYIEGENQEEY